MWTRVFWLQAAERATKAFAYSFLGLSGSDEAGAVQSGFWPRVLTSLSIAFISVLGSIVSSTVGKNKVSPSLVPTTEEQARRQ